MNLSIRTEPSDIPEYNAEQDVEMLLIGLSLDHPEMEDITLIDVIASIAESGGEAKEELNAILANALSKYDFFKTNRLLEDELEQV